MDGAALAKYYIDSVQNDAIEVATLTKLPELVSCGDWKRVEIVGSVNYVSDRTKITYNGLLVKQSGGLFYMKKKVADAVGAYDRRFLNVKKLIRVI